MVGSSQVNGGDEGIVLHVHANIRNTCDDGHGQAHSTYPPPSQQAGPSKSTSKSNELVPELNNDVIVRAVNRTPSPTPSEDAALKRSGVINWKAMRRWRFWFRREWLWYYVATVIILTLVALITIYDDEIVQWLRPTADRIRGLPAGWLIPVAIFFIISFPPLFGHGILAILVGLVWGLWIGFGITSAGTYLGEVGNFYAFKYLCRGRGEKLEKSNIQYACLAKIIREGGFWVALVARYSAFPGHFTTAVFATCGMRFWVYSLAAILSLPQQFIAVYIGAVLGQEGDGVDSPAEKTNRIVRNVVLAITIFITALAMWYLTKRMDGVKHDIIRERRKARQAKLEANMPGTFDGPTTGMVVERTDIETGNRASVLITQETITSLPPYPGRDTYVLAPRPFRPASVEHLGSIPTFRTDDKQLSD